MTTKAQATSLWTDAVRKIAEEPCIVDEGTDTLLKMTRIEALARSLFDYGVRGDTSAVKEIGQRLDGLPAQRIEMDATTDNTLRIIIDDPTKRKVAKK